MSLTDIEFLRVAYAAASELSDDPSTQNGAILVQDEKILCREANRFPVGVTSNPERWERPLKYRYVEHAERNVIYAAAKAGICTNGTTMYCPWFACSDCARAIIQSGIREVVGHQTCMDLGYAHWPNEIGIAHQMFTEAGVRFRNVVGIVGGVEIRFSGAIIQP